MALRLRTEMPSLKGITEWVNSEINNDDLNGKLTLIHFWAISCELCKEGLPEINQLRNDISQLQVVGIHMPRSEKDTEIDSVKNVIIKFELMHPQGIDNDHSVTDAFENEFVPSLYLFDHHGLLRHRSAGEKAMSLFRNPLQRVLEEMEREN